MIARVPAREDRNAAGGVQGIDPGATEEITQDREMGVDKIEKIYQVPNPADKSSYKSSTEM